MIVDITFIILLLYLSLILSDFVIGDVSLLAAVDKGD